MPFKTGFPFRNFNWDRRRQRGRGDSLLQASERGELHHALRAGCVLQSSVQRIGKWLIENGSIERRADAFTIAELTGLAAQELYTAEAVVAALGVSVNEN